jgi:hypothetical protein
MSKRDDSINLDLITMVQYARMQYDTEATPSAVPGVYWIEARRKAAATGKLPTPRAGEWRIPTTLDGVDTHWAQIKQATEAGKLGYKAKVSTAPAHGQTQREDRLICVRTYDADDAGDVTQVEETLKAMGFTDITYYRD